MKVFSIFFVGPQSPRQGLTLRLIRGPVLALKFWAASFVFREQTPFLCSHFLPSRKRKSFFLSASPPPSFSAVSNSFLRSYISVTNFVTLLRHIYFSIQWIMDVKFQNLRGYGCIVVWLDGLLYFSSGFSALPLYLIYIVSAASGEYVVFMREFACSNKVPTMCLKECPTGCWIKDVSWILIEIWNYCAKVHFFIWVFCFGVLLWICARLENQGLGFLLYGWFPFFYMS